MWEHADTPAIHGLRYLDVIADHARPSLEAFEAYLEQPRPVRKSLTGAVQASKEPSGKETADWMRSIDWVVVDDGFVGLTDLGRAVLASTEDQSGSAPVHHPSSGEMERSSSQVDEAFEAIVAEEGDPFVDE